MEKRCFEIRQGPSRNELADALFEKGKKVTFSLGEEKKTGQKLPTDTLFTIYEVTRDDGEGWLFLFKCYCLEAGLSRVTQFYGLYRPDTGRGNLFESEDKKE